MRVRGAVSSRPRMKRRMDAKIAAMLIIASSDKPLPSLLASPRVVRMSAVLVRRSTGRPLVWAANERSRMSKSEYAILRRSRDMNSEASGSIGCRVLACLAFDRD